MHYGTMPIPLRFYKFQQVFDSQEIGVKLFLSGVAYMEIVTRIVKIVSRREQLTGNKE